MANILNDRDLILQDSTTRLNLVNSDYISYTASDTNFTVKKKVATPSNITITFALNGRLQGEPTITTTGLTSVITTVVSQTVTTVVVPYASLTADTCTITASIVFAGNTYSTTVKISGKVVAPADVTGGNITVESRLLKLSWNKNEELDLAGYEVRTTNSGWGDNAEYLFRGNATSCLLNLTAPYTPGSVKTYYVRAYSYNELYSNTSTVLTYTISAPQTVASNSASFSTSSATSSTVYLSWGVATPVFGLKEYNVRIVLPNGTTNSWTVSTPNLSVDAAWTGAAAISVRVVDLLGNVSAWSDAYTLTKQAPANVVADPIPAYPIGTKLAINWLENSKTSLPIIGYEVRSENAGWGSGSGTELLWKGSATECQIDPGALGVIQRTYVKAVDSDNAYSTEALEISYTRAAPPAIADVAYSYSTSTTGQAFVTFNWNRPSGETFAIDYYRITLTKPGPTIVTIDSYANSWSVEADWVGTATLKISAVDVLGAESEVFTKSIYKVPLDIRKYTIDSPSVSGSDILLSWSPVTQQNGLVWSRSGTTATITDTSHGYVTGDTISVTSSSSSATIPVQPYAITVIDANSYNITCKNTGPTTGTLDTTYGSLQTTAYELRAANNTTVLYKGSSASFIVPGSLLSIGTNSFYLHAIDSAGKYSKNSRLLSYTYVGLANITGSARFTSTGTALFKWNPPALGSFPVKEYVLTLTGSSSTTVRSTTDWEVPVTWSNSTVQLSISPVDMLGNAGTSSSISLTNTLLPAPSSIAATLKGTTLELDWDDVVVNSNTQLPVGYYELQNTDNVVVWKGSQSKAIIPLVGVTPAKRTWKLYSHDFNGYASASPLLYEYTDLVNPSPITADSVEYSFGTNNTDSLLTLSWAPQSPKFGLKYYEVSYTDGDAAVTTTVLSTSLNISPIPKNSGGLVWTGTKQFSIVVVDALGNRSSTTTISVEKVAPGSVLSYTSQVIDNTVVLTWSLPIRTTLPISTVRLKRGAAWATAESIGDKTGTFTTILERIGGVYTYWAAAVDTDGVESAPVSLTATVAQPPDYIFLAERYSTFSGSKINAVIEDGTLKLPVDLTSTWTSHFTSNSWSGPSAQVAANYPVYIQPTKDSGSYEEIFDFDTILSSAKVTVNYTGTVLAGTVQVTTTISLSSDGVTWDLTTEGTSLFGTNFRYAKIKIAVAQADGGRGLYRIAGLAVSVDAKQKTESGSAPLLIGAAHPQGNISPDYISLWKPGTLPTGSYSLNGSTLENSISYVTAMGGYVQPIWECRDVDTTSDAEGGWNSSYFSANLSGGHLFAVFVRTFTNAGTAYWGTNTDNSLLNLDGSTAVNPYFWYGDLPSLNTWYLLVGYVHARGYSGSYAGISGVYDLTGTKVISGTEFKAASTGSSLMHRAYHYYNTEGSGQIVQQLARPIVISCGLAEAQDKLSYILTCATKYGASVDLPSKFIDITSITATPQGTSPTTTIVDFLDILEPKRFNLFNYSSTGNLTGGTVSWAVRGY